MLSLFKGLKDCVIQTFFLLDENIYIIKVGIS